jgi:hypothetical protein
MRAGRLAGPRGRSSPREIARNVTRAVSGTVRLPGPIAHVATETCPPAGGVLAATAAGMPCRDAPLRTEMDRFGRRVRPPPEAVRGPAGQAAIRLLSRSRARQSRERMVPMLTFRRSAASW